MGTAKAVLPALFAAVLLLTGCDDSPSAADVTACVKVHENDGYCPDARTIETVRKIDAKTEGAKAAVTAEVDFLIKSRMDVGSSIAVDCLAGQWTISHEHYHTNITTNYINPGQRWRVSLRLDFEKTPAGWKCTTQTLKADKASYQ